jgi:putative transposase
MSLLSRRTSALHVHRWSEPNVIYFVTWCTHLRANGLNIDRIGAALREIIRAMDATEDTTTHALTVMPDHVHWLFTLGNRLSLGRVIARAKSQSRLALATARLEWQRDFFEHRLGPDETVEPYALYIFLNPYRADLITAGEKWRNWWCPHPELLTFVSMLTPVGTPPKEWIGEAIPRGLMVGE